MPITAAPDAPRRSGFSRDQPIRKRSRRSGFNREIWIAAKAAPTDRCCMRPLQASPAEQPLDQSRPPRVTRHGELRRQRGDRSRAHQDRGAATCDHDYGQYEAYDQEEGFTRPRLGPGAPTLDPPRDPIRDYRARVCRSLGPRTRRDHSFAGNPRPAPAHPGIGTAAPSPVSLRRPAVGWRGWPP